MIRPEQVAGTFYPAFADELKPFLRKALSSAREALPAVAVMVPHAGYVYSGMTAGKVFSDVQIPDVVLMLGPNHTGLGNAFSLMASGAWQTPLGKVGIEEDLANALLDASPHLSDDFLGHAREHALEVELPFLQYLNPSVRIVPITIHTQDFQALREVAVSMAAVLRERNVLIVTSSDMTHYEPAAVAKEKDFCAIDAILKLDAEELRRIVQRQKISMCGFYPMYLTLYLSRALGASGAELIEYTNSGDVSGDFDSVVGYAGVVIR